eukprot:8059529-Lingulodinium_polyedra.AAC.1
MGGRSAPRLVMAPEFRLRSQSAWEALRAIRGQVLRSAAIADAAKLQVVAGLVETRLFHGAEA